MKIIISFIIAFICMNCNVECKKANAQGNGIELQYEEVVKNGMTYGIFYRICYGEYATVAVVNLTKDKLEVEMLQRLAEEKK